VKQHVSYSKLNEFYKLIADLNQCEAIDRARSSRIGLIYVFLPNRVDDVSVKEKQNEKGVTFKLNHFYSLLALSKLFKPASNDRLVFYYMNNSTRPTSNHYNRWINDSHWTFRLRTETINFVNLNYEFPSYNFDTYEIVNRVIEDSISNKRFDQPKDSYLLVTSDMIVGPRLLSCFSYDSTNRIGIFDSFDADALKKQYSNECYEKLTKNNQFYSILYHLDLIHNQRDFSGILLYSHNLLETQLKQTLLQMTVNQRNVYKCNYKNDIWKTQKYPFEDTLCVFGNELNIYEAPLLQNLFSPNNTNYFYKMVRYFLYKTYDAVRHTSSRNEVIPNLVHLIWFGDHYKVLKFIEYLCLKSILVVLKPDKVKIHGDIKPVGNLWDEISKHPKIEWVQIERPLFKYGQNFSSSPIQHLADIARLEVLYNEGGIYSDFDVLWVKPVDQLRYYDVELVAANDITSYCYEFPFSIQIGVFMAPKQSKFVREWLDGYHDYHKYPGDYVAISMCEPYKLYEKSPQRVLIENHLQMIYFNGWSVFIPMYTNVDQEKLFEFNNRLDWLNDGSFAYHLPKHSSLFSHKDFSNANKSDLPIQIASYIFNLPLN
jgi:hypothetical protein